MKEVLPMLIKNNITNLVKSAKEFKIETAKDLDNYKMTFLLRKGPINSLLTEMQSLPLKDRKEVGGLINELKSFLSKKYNDHIFLLNNKDNLALEDFDLSIPLQYELGARHPVTIVSEKTRKILHKMGFSDASGPEIEDEWHNFDALNIPKNHPARDMQDTFFLKNKKALRSQTSSVQIRTMEKGILPIRIVSVGKAYRRETISSRSHCFFNQVEVLSIDKNISMKDLKSTLAFFMKSFFSENINIRMRPSYFQFTEPSVEIDISCTICKSKGCTVCKHTGWVEIGGAGMVDPQVLKNCKINPNIYSGFAWGWGIGRMTMLLYGISDIRIFSENSLSFLNQFLKKFSHNT